MERKFYALGFYFSEDMKRVALIEKKRPAWQAGKLNGIGGKMEDDETPTSAMRREFIEEAGVKVLYWKMFATLNGSFGKVHCFKAVGDLTEVETKTDEKIRICNVRDLINFGEDQMIENLNWLLPLACDQDTKIVHAWLNEN